jgi:hypothetical protein
MAEPLRKDQELSTADLARTPERPRLVPNAPAGEEIGDDPRDAEFRDAELRDVESDDRRDVDDDAVLEHKPPAGVRDMSARNLGRDIDLHAEPQRNLASMDARHDTQRGTPGAAHIEASTLFSDAETGDFRSRWSDVQAAFVDEPREAVKRADELVASLMKKLAEGFAKEREKLEHAWDRGENVSTEDLRIALQRYRSFFDRLLKA